MFSSRLTHHWSVLTKNAMVDTRTNNVVLGEVVEEIQCRLLLAEKEKFEEVVKKEGAAAMPFEAFLTSYLEADAPDVDRRVRFDLMLPNGQAASSTETSMRFGPNKRGRNIHKISGLPIIGSGRYGFRVLSVGDDAEVLLAELPLFVRVVFE